MQTSRWLSRSGWGLEVSSLKGKMDNSEEPVTSTKSATRSRTFFDESGVAGFTHRAFTKSMGYDDADMGRPVIGICNTFSELNNCNRHLKELAEAVKRGVCLLYTSDAADDN